MKTSAVAKASVHINATRAEVWDALVNPVTISKYMFGTEISSEFTEGSSITWKGEWDGKPYEDHGEVVQVRSQEKLVYTHSSAGDRENIHTITIQLSGDDGNILVSLTQDNNAGEEAAAESTKNWEHMLGAMKKLIEEGRA